MFFVRQFKPVNDLTTQYLLKQAKEELVAVAVMYADNYGPAGAGPGHLPCPNVDIPDGRRINEGPSPPCGGKEVLLGRLPRLAGISQKSKTLNYQRGIYTADQALWYAVSGNFINNPIGQNNLVNPHSKGKLNLDKQNEVVALIIAAGESVSSGQSDLRPSAMPKAYLELENADGDADFSRNSRVLSNDRLVAITLREIMPLVRSRVLAYVVKWLGEYRKEQCGASDKYPCFPYATQHPGGECEHGDLAGWLSIGKGSCDGSLFSELLFEGVPIDRHWFIRNGWHKFIRYKIDENCLLPHNDQCRIETSEHTVGEEVYPQIEILTANSG